MCLDVNCRAGRNMVYQFVARCACSLEILDLCWDPAVPVHRLTLTVPETNVYRVRPVVIGRSHHRCSSLELVSVKEDVALMRLMKPSARINFTMCQSQNDRLNCGRQCLDRSRCLK